MNYEIQDASLRVIGISVALLVAGLVGSLITSSWYYHRRYGNPALPPSTIRQTSFMNGPHQRLGIAVDWEKIDAATAKNLNGYGWVDEHDGIVRIPIDRALELAAHGTQPARDPAPPPEQKWGPDVNQSMKQP